MEIWFDEHNASLERDVGEGMDACAFGRVGQPRPRARRDPSLVVASPAARWSGSIARLWRVRRVRRPSPYTYAKGFMTDRWRRPLALVERATLFEYLDISLAVQAASAAAVRRRGSLSRCTGGINFRSREGYQRMTVAVPLEADALDAFEENDAYCKAFRFHLRRRLWLGSGVAPWGGTTQHARFQLRVLGGSTEFPFHACLLQKSSPRDAKSRYNNREAGHRLFGPMLTKLPDVRARVARCYPKWEQQIKDAAVWKWQRKRDDAESHWNKRWLPPIIVSSDGSLQKLVIDHVEVRLGGEMDGWSLYYFLRLLEWDDNQDVGFIRKFMELGIWD